MVDALQEAVVEMKAFAEISRRMRRAGIDYAELEEQRRDLGGAELPAARFRCHRPKMLNVYRKPVS